jgi:hypothetical protein
MGWARRLVMAVTCCGTVFGPGTVAAATTPAGVAVDSSEGSSAVASTAQPGPTGQVQMAANLGSATSGRGSVSVPDNATSTLGPVPGPQNEPRVPDPLSHLPAFLAATHRTDPVPELGQAFRLDEAIQAAETNASTAPTTTPGSTESGSTSPADSATPNSTPAPGPVAPTNPDAGTSPGAGGVLPQLDGETLSLSGTVSNADGAVLAGMSVILYSGGLQQSHTTTDASGSYTLEAPNAGQWAIEILDPAGTYFTGFYTPAGWSWQWAFTTFTTSQTGLDVVMPLARHISGTIVDLAGAPQLGVPVWASLCDEQGVEQRQLGFGADGSYSWPVPAGRLTIQLMQGGSEYVVGWVGVTGTTTNFADAAVFDTTSGDLVKNLMVLHTVPNIMGIVHDKDGQPVAGVQVSSLPQTNTSTTDGEGRYRLVIGSQAVRLRFQAPNQYISGYYAGPSELVQSWEAVVLNPTSDMLVNVTLKDKPTIWGKVVDSSGAAVSGIRVHAAGTPSSYQTTTGASGTYSLMVDVNTSYVLSFRDDQGTYATVWYKAGSYSFLVEDATPINVATDPINVDMTMIANTPVSGRVLDADDAPVSGAVVAAYWSGSLRASSTTAADGSYSLSLHPGTYGLKISKSGYATVWYKAGSYAFDSSLATPVVVGSSEVTVGDARMPGTVHITGTVTNVSSTGLANIEVDFFLHNGYVGHADTAGNGSYSMALPPGEYSIGFYDPAGVYSQGWLSASGFNLDSSTAKIIVLADSDVGAGTVALPQTHRIKGSVGWSPGDVYVAIEAFVDGMYYITAVTDYMGTFSIPVAPGTITLWFFDATGAHAAAWYMSSGWTADWAKATGIHVSSADVSIGEIPLRAAQKIPIHTQDSVLPNYPLGDVVLEAYFHGVGVGFAVTNGNGNGTLALLSGTYLISADARSTIGNHSFYGVGWYTSASGHFTPDASAASGLAAPHGSVTLLIPDGGEVTGRLADQFGRGLQGIEVEAFLNGRFYSSVTTQSDGSYHLKLQPASYNIGFYDPFLHYAAVWYSSSGGVSYISDATSIAISSGQSIVLSPQLPLYGPPSQPAGARATAYNATALVFWDHVMFDGGSAITAYTVTAVEDDTKTCATTGETFCTVAGLTNGQQYTFTVVATNEVGDGPPSGPSDTVTPHLGSSYYTVAPYRVMDSRYDIGAGIFHSRVKQSVLIADGSSGVPAAATAVTGNLTIVSQTNKGYVTVAPTLTSGVQPPTSTLNFPYGDIRANGVTVPLAAGGNLDFMYWASRTTDTVQIIFDVTGFFYGATSLEGTDGSSYYTVAPYRVMDSRYDIGAGIFHSRTPQTVQIATTESGVPADATAITGNLTIVSQTRQGYVTVAPGATLTQGVQPPTSTLNFPLGDIRANNVTVPLAAGGNLDFMYWASAGSTVQVIFDVTGYFRADDGGATYFALSPYRVMDSRYGIGAVIYHARTKQTVRMATAETLIPANASAVTGNLTIVSQTRQGYVTVDPALTSGTQPPTSTLNFPLGDIRANGVIAPLAANGYLDFIYWAARTSDTVQVIFDVTGFFG